MDKYSLPDEMGHFGEFGGQFIPETLMPALQELEQSYIESQADSRFVGQMDELARTYAGRPTALYFASNLTEQPRWGEDIFQAGGPGSHRRPQDQQRAGTGAAGAPDGQEADHRRDWRGTARRRRGPPFCAMLGLECIVYMGGEGYPAAISQRVSDEAVGRRSRFGRKRQQDAEGRDQRGDP